MGAVRDLLSLQINKETQCHLPLQKKGLGARQIRTESVHDKRYYVYNNK